ncbi:pyruvate phosphate dikinase, PEP/pyruvate binding domain protein [Mycobacterium kansasii]|uniref:Pyruvate phosphate dikinase, PEP/pyruvate binding domain protein n=1 Tax=Mycobacterium kansasii TaxID=1768 RepID=A0A1V3XJN6_MYCKA|nr:pyruvate phosphate dikinase, PEP/pyruvate binding domain protein [Mycobacterium kansasii]
MVLLDGQAEHSREVLGNKGHGIDVMRRHALPVPPAFCITTEVGVRYLADPDPTMDAIWDVVIERMGWLEAETSRTFGRGPRPLLVSVRSGATQSMPGMMDTILDLGVNDAVEQALARACTAEFARDTRRRFNRMYRRVTGQHPAEDPYEQLRVGIGAVFTSWNSPRAKAYREHYGRDDQGGTAVVVQAMVFGNQTARSGAGVLSSRNPITGANEPFGDWLPGGQGDDVVSGLVDVEPIATLRDELPAVYDELIEAARRLEQLTSDVPEIEFTVENGKLWLLQTRSAERSAQAAVRLALQLRHDGLIDDAQTLRRVTPAAVEAVLRPPCNPKHAWPHRFWPKVCPPARAWQPESPTPTWMRRWTRPSGASRSSWCATTPGPKTSWACWPHRASSPRWAARPATRQWSAASSAGLPSWVAATV